MDINTRNMLLELLSAVAIGLVIGVEREYRSKPAGLRTLMLVSLGACIFTQISLILGVENPDRLAANVITGIGFLGAGAIFKDDNKVNGLTTASTIWVCAGLGMAVGAKHYALALWGTLLVLMVLSVLVYFEKMIDRSSTTRPYTLVCKYSHEALIQYETLFKKAGLTVVRGQHQIKDNMLTGQWRLTGSEKAHQQLVATLVADNTLLEFAF